MLKTFAILVALGFFAFATAATAQMLGAPPKAAPLPEVEVHQLPVMETTIKFDPEKATNEYLARVKGPARARSDAYFEGGYTLQIVDIIYAIAFMAALLWSGISARIRNYTQRLTPSRFWQVILYFIGFFVLVVIATFPLSVYELYFRKHSYGLSNQNFAQWLGDFTINSGIALVITTILVTFLYACIRAARRTWWLLGAGLSAFFLAVTMLIYPVFLAPMLNHYQPLPDSLVKQQILSMARANGVPATNVYKFDTSQQSDRISANVSGLFGTTQISLTDNLLKRGTPREIKAVLGHEIGHYVLNHAVVNLLWLSLVIACVFWLTDRAFRLLVGIFGNKWEVRAIEDPAGLPALYASFAFFMFLAMPFVNTITRTQETQADLFGVNAAREPDAFATTVLKLSKYRKLDPSAVEEWIFYDHPSGRNRIYAMMRWKAEHINDPDVRTGPASPQ